METDTKEVKIYKKGELVATASHVRHVEVSMPGCGEDEEVIYDCYHLPRVNLERLLIFRILNREPMSSIFNDAGVEIHGEQVEPVYYVHGIVETFRGNPYISSVVLAKPNKPVTTSEFAKNLPELYRRFSAAL